MVQAGEFAGEVDGVVAVGLEAAGVLISFVDDLTVVFVPDCPCAFAEGEVFGEAL